MRTLKIAIFTAIIATTGVFGYTSYQKNQKPALSELAMANIEALTQNGETSKVAVYKTCWTGTPTAAGRLTDYCSDKYTDAGTNCAYKYLDAKKQSTCISYYK